MQLAEILARRLLFLTASCSTRSGQKDSGPEIKTFHQSRLLLKIFQLARIGQEPLPGGRLIQFPDVQSRYENGGYGMPALYGHEIGRVGRESNRQPPSVPGHLGGEIGDDEAMSLGGLSRGLDFGP